MPDMNQDPLRENSFRHWLAGGITAVAIVGAVVLGAVAILRPNTAAQTILGTVLPVIGTWVGTVLAYYFSKESLEAATRSVSAIAREVTPEEKLRSKPAQSVMIPRDQMFIVRGPAPQVNLLGALKALEDSKKGDRLPVLDASDHPLYVAHRSTVDAFLVAKVRGAAAADLSGLTLADMLSDPDRKSMLENSFATIRQDATLADAKIAMDAVKYAQDVFVTKTGNQNEPVLGWITNNIIEDNARV
ncbi:MAG: hypothetical protein JOY54_05420 [Acidobacteriaceae bacterium]|nr:hypothetical protein [Acidobacteriaceae bacterium]